MIEWMVTVELGELLATGVAAGNNFGRAGAEWRRGQGRRSGKRILEWGKVP